MIARLSNRWVLTGVDLLATTSAVCVVVGLHIWSQLIGSDANRSPEEAEASDPMKPGWPVMTLGRSRPTIVRADLSEDEASPLTGGESTVVQLDGAPGVQVDATVTVIEQPTKHGASVGIVRGGETEILSRLSLRQFVMVEP